MKFNNSTAAAAAELPPVVRPTCHVLLRFSAWYGFWLVTVLALYWQVLPALPFRDQPHLMLNHQLAESDWQWFRSMLSYNRTRILHPGDYMLFRPVHMVVIALQDIFLRYHIVAQGVVNCMLFAFAATVFCSLAKRFAGTVAALALTLLWVSQLAGSSVVFWQHIAPYILCPAFFMLALRVLDADDLGWSRRNKVVAAALCVFAAALTHEIGVATALAVTMATLLLCRRDTGRTRQLLIVFCLPVTSALLINLLDYLVIHPPPSLLTIADAPSFELTFTMVLKFIGAIGTALLASPALHLDKLPDGFIQWRFYNEAPLLLYAMAVPVTALLVTAGVVVVRETRPHGLTNRALTLMLLLFFFLATFAVCAFRMHMRGTFYMASATYYYALFAVAQCGIAACLLKKARTGLLNILVIIVLVASTSSIAASRSYFSKSAHYRSAFKSMVTEGRKVLSANPGLCFSGSIPAVIAYDSMFFDLSCASRPGATPLHLHTDEVNRIWLSSALYTSIDAAMVPTAMAPAIRLPANNGWVTYMAIHYGHDLQFTVNKADNFTISISDQHGDRQAITIERNLLKKSTQTIRGLRPELDEASLDRDSADFLITYKIGFSKDSILLFADGRLIGDLPALPPDTAFANFALHSTGSTPADVGNLLIADQPSSGALQLAPRYLLTRN